MACIYLDLKTVNKIPHRSWNTLEDWREHFRTGWKPTLKEGKWEQWKGWKIRMEESEK